MRLFVVILFVLSTAQAGCSADRNQTIPSPQFFLERRDTKDDVRRKVTAIIPIGSSIEQAQQIMRASGFECSLQVDEGATTRQGRCGLICTFSKQVEFLISHKWMVWILAVDGLVTKVDADMGVIAP